MGYVTRMGDMRNVCKILDEKTVEEKQTPLRDVIIDGETML
jgi:hypothetical protein